MVGFKPKNPAEKRSKAKPVIKVIKIKPWKHKTVKTHTNYNCTWSKENFQQISHIAQIYYIESLKYNL